MGCLPSYFSVNITEYVLTYYGISDMIKTVKGDA